MQPSLKKPEFTGKLQVPVVHKNGQLKMTPKHKLSSQSHPAEILDIFVPFHNNKYNKTNKGEFPYIEAWTKYTNAKAILANAGQPGMSYPKFKPYSMSEICQHVGAYILNGPNYLLLWR
jgi:hypothetical protein